MFEAGTWWTRQATVIQNTQAHLKSKGEEAFANHDARTQHILFT